MAESRLIAECDHDWEDTVLYGSDYQYWGTSDARYCKKCYKIDPIYHDDPPKSPTVK